MKAETAATIGNLQTSPDEGSIVWDVAPDQKGGVRMIPYPGVQQAASNINVRQTIHILCWVFEVVLVGSALYFAAYLSGFKIDLSVLACLTTVVIALTVAARRFISNSDPHSLASQHCSPTQAALALVLSFTAVIMAQSVLDSSHIKWQLGGAAASVTIIFLMRTIIWKSGWGLTDGGIAILGELNDARKIAQAIGRPNRCPIVACLPYDEARSFVALRNMVDGGHVEGVVLTSIPAEQQQAVVSAIADLPIAVYLAPQIGLTRSSLDNVVAVLPNNLVGHGGFTKRAIDLVSAAFGLLICLPLFAVIAVIIKLESPGPVFFRQVRFGLGGRATEIWKFRTMYIDRGDKSGEMRTLARDPRVTRFGRILRRLSLDELPQLINVLQGSMSLVGPRPHVTQMRIGTAFYRDAVVHYPLRHRVKPGITGWAQINGSRGEVDTMEKAERRVSLDLWYISHWSLALDVKILLRTLFGGFATLQAD